MSYGKEIFRGKYKETMDSLNIIKDNYYDLDYEYQMIAKKLQQKENIIKEVREYIKTNCLLSDTWEELENHQFIPTGRIYYKSLNGEKIKELLEILDKEK